MQDVCGGVERLRTWPKKRGKKLPQKTLDQMEFFRQVQIASKLCSPDQLIAWEQATRGTPLLPRDMFLMMWSNRLCAITIEGGRTLYPQVAINDVSQSLDVIAQTPGDMLRRGVDQWEPFTLPTFAPQVCAVRRTSAFAAGAANTYAPISWQASTYDPSGIWDITDPTKLTMPGPGTALCFLNATATFGAFAQTIVAWAINGNVDYRQRPPYPTAGGDVAINVSALFRVTTGDVLTAPVASSGAGQGWDGCFAAILFLPDA